MSFTHLHVHTEYSLLDSMAKIKPLVKKIKDLGMNSCAITDHGVCYGLVEFYNECKKNGIKPILGCEVYTAPESRFDKQSSISEKKYFHEILLVKNEAGYKNLCRLVTRSNTEGFYSKPRIDFELLSKYHEGLICTSACVGGRLQQYILRGEEKKAEEWIQKYIDLFGDDYYLEIQNHGLAEEEVIRKAFKFLSEKYKVKIVCSNDTHYINKEDAEAHEWMLCLQTGKKLSDENRMKYEGDYSIKSEDEMRLLFPDFPEAIDNTQEIADKCNFDFSFANVPSDYRMPKVYIPEEFNGDYYKALQEEVKKGFIKLFPEGHPEREEAKKRIRKELKTIKDMGFSEYFLDTQKTIKKARSKNILVGPGRGSAPGSIICYCMGITSVDAIKYNLIPERFLNPERISMPDIDVDYSYAYKDDVIRMEAESNGLDKFCKIQTFTGMLAKGILRDCARVAGFSPSIGSKLAGYVIGTDSLSETYEKNPELRKYIDSEEGLKKLWDIALKLEGLKKASSTHACGHIPTPIPCEELFPCSVESKTGYLVCQYNMSDAETLGNLKKDILMLRNLDIIDVAQTSIYKRFGNKIPFWTEEILNDKDALNLVAKGETNGVFQLESEGMKNFMKDLKPDCFEDIIAGVSLYRPGPMDFIPQYVKGKHDKNSIHYLVPQLEHILDKTYGCIVYQEQVMQIVRDLAGFSMGRSDKVRKAMGKKKLDIMEAEGKNFIYGNESLNIQGCIKNGIKEEDAKFLWNQMSEFAKYAFNKSHAASYAQIAMQTAYLKAHYPSDFYAGLLSSVMDDTDKLTKYLTECRKNGVKILPPDINTSIGEFSVVKDNVLSFGLCSLKGVGREVISDIIEERNKNGSYLGLTDFIKRNSPNKTLLEALIYTGAFDFTGHNRSTLIQEYPEISLSMTKEKKKNMEGQMDIFSFLESNGIPAPESPDSFIERKEFPKRKVLDMELKYCGTYLSGHPLETYSDYISNFPNSVVNIIGEGIEKEDIDGKSVKICGLIKEIRYTYTKKDKKMAFLLIEDLTGEIKATVFPLLFERIEKKISEGKLIRVDGKVSVDSTFGTAILADDVIFLDELKKNLFIRLEDKNKAKKEIEYLKKICNNNKGIDDVYLFFRNTKGIEQLSGIKIGISENILSQLKSIFGNENVEVRISKNQ